MPVLYRNFVAESSAHAIRIQIIKMLVQFLRSSHYATLKSMSGEIKLREPDAAARPVRQLRQPVTMPVRKPTHFKISKIKPADALLQ